MCLTKRLELVLECQAAGIIEIVLAFQVEVKASHSFRLVSCFGGNDTTMQLKRNSLIWDLMLPKSGALSERCEAVRVRTSELASPTSSVGADNTSLDLCSAAWVALARQYRLELTFAAKCLGDAGKCPKCREVRRNCLCNKSMLMFQRAQEPNLWHPPGFQTRWK